MDAIAFIVIFQSMNSILTKGVLRGGGDTKFLMVADIIFLWAASLPLGILAGLVWHLDAFWIYVFLKNRSDLYIDMVCIPLEERKVDKNFFKGENESCTVN